MANELKQPVSAIELPSSVERPPTAAEVRLFGRFCNELERLDRIVSAAGLRMQNIYTAARFSSAAGLPVISVSGDEEELYYSLRDRVRQLRAAERGVIDWQAGIRTTSSGRDIDIVLFPGQQLGAIPLVIPALIGVVIAAAAVAAAVSAIKDAHELSRKLNAVMETADRELCKDPLSDTCQNWQTEKAQKNWQKNKSIADSIGSAVEKIGGGLGIGIVVALGIFAFLKGRK
jgi:hypothetical protein